MNHRFTITALLLLISIYPVLAQSTTDDMAVVRKVADYIISKTELGI